MSEKYILNNNNKLRPVAEDKVRSVFTQLYFRPLVAVQGACTTDS